MKVIITNVLEIIPHRLVDVIHCALISLVVIITQLQLTSSSICDWLCGNHYVCIYQYFEKWHFEIFNLKNLPHLGIGHAYSVQQYLVIY